jgi:hypothetical protein
MGGFLRPSRLHATIVFFVAALLGSAPASSQNRSGAPLPNKPELGAIGERINSNTIALVSWNVNAAGLSIAYDLSAVLDNGDEFRVLPVVHPAGGPRRALHGRHAEEQRSRAALTVSEFAMRE